MSETILTLMRHAKSSWRNQEQADHERPLNKRGNRDAPVMASRLLQRSNAPSIILSSTAKRTRQTTAHVLEVFGLPAPEVKYLDSLYLASPAQILAALNTVPDDTHHVMVIAHNPGMEELSAALAGLSSDTMPTAAVRQFSCRSITELNTTVRNDSRKRAADAAGVTLVYSDYPKSTEE